MKRRLAVELRPCLSQGASLGKEAVLADSGRAGEVGAGVGRVRSLDFLSILLGVFLLSRYTDQMKFRHEHRVFQQFASR